MIVASMVLAKELDIFIPKNFSVIDENTKISITQKNLLWFTKENK